MPLTLLTSRENSLLKSFRLAASEARKSPAEVVVAEGLRTVREAVKAGSILEAVLLSRQFAEAAEENGALTSWLPENVRVYCTPDSLFKSVSGVQSPQGILALVRAPVLTLQDTAVASRPMILCACGIQDPGNLGTLIRTAAAAGASMVCTSPGTVSARNLKAIRASAGTFFHVPVIERVPAAQLRDFCAERNVTPYRTDAYAGGSYLDCDFRSGCAILLGNEGAGVAEVDWSGVASIRIPMASDVESLNVAAAGAIVLFEARKQRSSIAGADLR